MINCREEALLKLGFAETAYPSHEDIKKQYRLLALKFHPDKVYVNSVSAAEMDSMRLYYTEEFKNISQAYQILLLPLKDQPKRADFSDDAMHVCCVMNFISPELLFQRVFHCGVYTVDFLIAQLNSLLSIFDENLPFEELNVDCSINPSEFRVVIHSMQQKVNSGGEIACESSMRIRQRKGLSIA